MAVADTADYRVGRPLYLGGLLIDLNGVILLAAAVGGVALALLYFQWRKWLAGRGRMPETDAGAFRLAAARGRIADMELLSVLPGFRVDADVVGWTALMAAAAQGQAAACVWLLEHGADINKLKEDSWRDTVLHYAAGKGCAETARVLLAYGSDAAAKNALGATPADVATKAGHKELASQLQAVAEGKQEVPQRQAMYEKYKPAISLATKTVDGSNGTATSAADKLKAAKKLAKREFEGYGRPGTVPRPEVKYFRPIAILTEVLGGFYLAWRALRTLQPGWGYFYSMPWWLAEFSAYCLSFSFITGLFYMVDRPMRHMHEMLDADKLPHCDIYICTYSEPPDVVEPTAIATLNMNWPTSKSTVHILDDGSRLEMASLVRRLQFQCRHMKREANICYVARQKVKGVPHHAKAGNINSCLLKEGVGKGEFILVLDCDMIVHPDILDRMLGHFYRKREPGEEGTDAWVVKERAAFLQTPQDFYNVAPTDPMVHCARFFYGPMLQGRDGVGGCPCCGTGVVFRRDILVSMGGQSYGSITEDYNTAMALLSAGHATMFLNERLSYGLAPDDIPDVFGQRLRWSMGALQILMNANPLRLPGLSFSQSILYFEAAAHNYLSITTVMMLVVPVIYLFVEYSPMICESLWEFTAIFGSWYACNRVMMILLHYRTEGGLQELWRGSQMWVWGAPNQLLAIWKVLVAENAIVKRLFKFEITFVVTKKDKTADENAKWDALKAGLRVTWPHITYIVAFTAGTIYFIVTAALGYYTAGRIMLLLAAMCWGMLGLLCIFPPVQTLFPRVETESGWKIAWQPANPEPTSPKPQRAMSRMLSGMSRMMSTRRTPTLNVRSPDPLGSKQFQNSTLELGASPSRNRSFMPLSGSGNGRTSTMFRPSMDVSPTAANGGLRGVVVTADGSVPPGALPSEMDIGDQPTNSTSSVSPRIGRVGMGQRRQLALQQSALLTSVVLPERSLQSVTSVMLDAYGNASPLGPQAAQSVILGVGQGLPSIGRTAQISEAGSPDAAKQKWAFSQLAELTGIDENQAEESVSATLVDVAALEQANGTGQPKPQHSASPPFLSTVLEEPEPDGTDQPQYSGSTEYLSVAALEEGPEADGAANAAASAPAVASAPAAPTAPPVADSAADTASATNTTMQSSGGLSVSLQGSVGGKHSVSVPKVQTPAYVSPFAMLAMEHRAAPVDEDALAAELGDEFAATGGPVSRLGPSNASLYMSKTAAALAEIAASLSPANASMLALGQSMVVPVVPATIWEHSLHSKPDFTHREPPATSHIFALVNIAILASLVAGAVLDAQFLVI